MVEECFLAKRCFFSGYQKRPHLKDVLQLILPWANRGIFAWQHTTCLGPLKELITPREGPRRQLVRANRDVFT
jgi:hypothetical protein